MNDPVRYRSDHLLTVSDEPRVISDGVVDVADGRVIWSGSAAGAPPHEGQVERLRGLLMPGFVNCHAHTPMVLFRGAGEGLPVGRWLTEVIWRREGRLTAEDVWWAMTLGAAELLGNGITTTHEMYFYPEEVARAAIAAGLRGVVTPPILAGEDLSRFGSWQDQLDTMVTMAEDYSDHDLITIGLGPHSAYAVPEEPLRAIAEVSTEKGLHVHIHVAEARDEGDGIHDEHGVTVPRYLEGLGMFDTRVVAAHGVWLTDDDIGLLAEHDVGVAHCPVSNGKHASGIAPVTDLRSAGVPVAIATDGPSSNDRLDPFEEMRAALSLARIRAGDAAVMGPGDAIVMATREAGAVLGRDDLGHLGVGARADIVLVDTTSLGPVVEVDDLLTHLVYSGTPSLVDKVWVGGQPVVASGEATTVDREMAHHEVDQRARRLANEV